MAEYTKNLNLEKPAQNEFYDIDVQNQNMDIIDEEIQGLKNKNDTLQKSVAIIGNNRTDFQEGEDLNDFLTVGCFRSTTNARTRSLLNCPTDLAFTMDIVSGTGWHNTVTAEAGFIVQKILDHGGNAWFRPVYASNGSILFDKWIKTATSDGELSCDENAATIVSYTGNAANDRRVLALCNQNFKEVKEALRWMDATNDVQKYFQIFGEHNKPRGTYTGNGDGTNIRDIDFSGTGKLLLVYSSNGFAIINPRGAVVVKGETVTALTTKHAYYGDGILHMATNDAVLNASGVTYTYQVL